MRKFEPFVYIAVFFVLCVALVAEGAKASSLQRKLPITSKELYRQLAKGSVKAQIIDIRPDVEDNYEDSHIPGAIPFPDCDLAAAPEPAREMIEVIVPTVIVSQDGDPEAFERCASKFRFARNLEGGLDAWVDDEGFPEVDGEYEQPSVGAGGGCL